MQTDPQVGNLTGNWLASEPLHLEEHLLTDKPFRFEENLLTSKSLHDMENWRWIGHYVFFNHAAAISTIISQNRSPTCAILPLNYTSIKL